MAFDFSQLVRDLQKIQVKLDEGFVEEAQEQLEFVIDEVNIAAQQSPQADRTRECPNCHYHNTEIRCRSCGHTYTPHP